MYPNTEETAVWLHLLKNNLMENFFFCAVFSLFLSILYGLIQIFYYDNIKLCSTINILTHIFGKFAIVHYLYCFKHSVYTTRS